MDEGQGCLWGFGTGRKGRYRGLFVVASYQTLLIDNISSVSSDSSVTNSTSANARQGHSGRRRSSAAWLRMTTLPTGRSNRVAYCWRAPPRHTGWLLRSAVKGAEAVCIISTRRQRSALFIKWNGEQAECAVANRRA